MRVLVCSACHCELERTEMAGGRAVVFCVACRVTSDHSDFEDGARLVDMPQEPRRSLKPQRPAVRAGLGRRLATR